MHCGRVFAFWWFLLWYVEDVMPTLAIEPCCRMFREFLLLSGCNNPFSKLMDFFKNFFTRFFFQC